MRVTKYKTKLSSEGLAYLVKENACNYQGDCKMNTPVSIVKMLNDVFDLCNETEEYLYLLCFNTAYRLLGVFELSHGIVNASMVSPREVFQKALLCNASHIIIAHNHPSGSTEPSRSDREVFKVLRDAGTLMNVPLIDSIIVGSNNDYYSFESCI